MGGVVLFVSFASPEVPQKVPHKMWYVSRLIRTLLDDRNARGVGNKGLHRQYRKPLDAMQADSLSATIVFGPL